MCALDLAVALQGSLSATAKVKGHALISTQFSKSVTVEDVSSEEEEVAPPGAAEEEVQEDKEKCEEEEDKWWSTEVVWPRMPGTGRRDGFFGVKARLQFRVHCLQWWQ